MPWKGEKDPYKIWLSEVILQQTRVEQGWAYYEKFVAAYPTIQQLAAASDEAVFKLWEGLGYYNRCRNLLFTARYITENMGGNFPADYDSILALKGVGPYTAAAIASFAFNLPYAVVDGNVFRVLSRCFGIDTAIDSAEGRKIFSKLAEDVLDKKQPGLYNQAIMDFGATVCKPAMPLCGKCPLQQVCFAWHSGRVNHLPVKEKVLQKKNRWFTYFLFACQGKMLVSKRTGNDIWQSLHEPYLLETEEKPAWDKETVFTWLKDQLDIAKARLVHVSPVFNQQLTHQNIKAQFIKIELTAIPPSLQPYMWVTPVEAAKLAFPKIINSYFETTSFQPTLF